MSRCRERGGKPCPVDPERFMPAKYLYFSTMKGYGGRPGIVAVVLVSLLAVSCGGGSDTGGEAPEATAASGAVSETTAAPTTAAAPTTTVEGATATTTTTGAATATTAAPTTTEAPDPAPTEGEAAPETEEPVTTTSTTAPPSEPLGPPAEDFTLELSTGETFVLSQQTTPVLIFFWAEW